MSTFSIFLVTVLALFLAVVLFLWGFGVGFERGKKLEREKVPFNERAFAKGMSAMDGHIVATVQRNLSDGHFDASIDRAIRRNNRRRQA